MIPYAKVIYRDGQISHECPICGEHIAEQTDSTGEISTEVSAYARHYDQLHEIHARPEYAARVKPGTASPLWCARCGEEITPGTAVEFRSRVDRVDMSEARIVVDDDLAVVHAQCPIDYEGPAR